MDWFHGREQERAEQAAEQELVEQQQQEAMRELRARAGRDRHRRWWLEQWLRYGLTAVPSGVDPETRLQVHEAVQQRLEKCQAALPGDVTRQVVDAIIEATLSPWRRRQEIKRVLEAAVDQLPYQAKSYYEPTSWQIRATQLARQVVRGLDADAALCEVEAAAKAAVATVTQEFEDAQRKA
jgi:hypothetical protein